MTVTISGAGSPFSSTSSNASYTFAIFFAVDVCKARAFLYFIGFFVSDCDCASIWTEENANNIASTENKCNENLFFITY